MNISNLTPSFIALTFGRDFLPTAEAAKAMNRKRQTLHKWAMNGTGPVRPVRQGGRLAWPVAEIARFLQGEA